MYTDTGHEIYLLSFLQLNFEQFMNGFLVIQGIHDGQVDDTAQVHQVSFCPVFDALLGLSNYADIGQLQVIMKRHMYADLLHRLTHLIPPLTLTLHPSLHQESPP